MRIRLRIFYQPELSISIEFCEKHFSKAVLDAVKGNNEQILIDVSGSCYPDFIRAKWRQNDQKYYLSVVDVKLAKRPKIEHKIQICMYILLLEDFIDQNGLSDIFVVNREKGYLFNRGQDKEKEFSAEEPMRFLNRFLSEEISLIVDCASKRKSDDGLMGDLPYRISQKCEWCENYENCVNRCKANNERIMLLPYLSLYAQDYLYELKERGSLKSFDTEEFRKFCSTSEGAELLRQSIYWKRFLPDKDAYLDALIDGSHTIVNRSCASYEMPGSENVQVILTAQKDEGYDLCYAFGIYVKVNGAIDFDLPEIPKEITNAEGIAISSTYSPTEIKYSAVVKDMKYQKTLERLFVRELYIILKRISDRNAQIRLKKNRFSLQLYVMDNYELNNIEDILYDLHDLLILNSDVNWDGTLFDQVTAILNCLQGTRLVEYEGAEKSVEVIPTPTVILTSVVSKLFVLPAIVSYSMQDVLNVFFDRSYPKEDELLRSIEASVLLNKKSNVFKNTLINNYWEKPDCYTDAVKTIIDHIETRLIAESLLIEKMRKTNSASIRRGATKFRIPKIDKTQNFHFSDLRFEAIFEQSISEQRIRSVQCMNIDQAIEEGKILQLKLIEEISSSNGYETVFEILNANSMVKEEVFKAYICKDTPECRRNLPFYEDDDKSQKRICCF